MGQQISALLEGMSTTKKEDKTKQELEVLQRMVDAVLDKFDADLNAKFLNPDNTAKTEVPGIRALRRTRFSTCELNDKPSEDVNKAIDQFFGAASGESDPRKAVSAGFKSAVNAALNTFMGYRTAGQKEETKYFIYMAHNSIIRVDVKLWRWNFGDEGFSSTHKQVLGYVACVSVVDVGVLKTSEFVYLLSEYAGDDEEAFTKYCASMTKMYQTARNLKKAQKIPPIEED